MSFGWIVIAVAGCVLLLTVAVILTDHMTLPSVILLSLAGCLTICLCLGGLLASNPSERAPQILSVLHGRLSLARDSYFGRIQRECSVDQIEDLSVVRVGYRYFVIPGDPIGYLKIVLKDGTILSIFANQRLCDLEWVIHELTLQIEISRRESSA